MAKSKETSQSSDAIQSERLFALNIEGLTPLIHHNIEGMPRVQEVLDKGKDPAAFEREHVDWWLYTDAQGRPIFPARNIHKAFIESCRFMTIKPPGRMQSWAPMVTSAMIVMDDLPLEEWERWPSQVRVGRATITRWRPRFNKWGGQVGVVVFDEALTAAVLDDLAYRVGRYSGFGDARKIGFGRCKITVVPA